MGANEARLMNLFRTLSEELCNARPTSEAQDFAIQRQAGRMRKRAQLGVPGLDRVALENFETTNDLVGNTVINVDSFIEHNAREFIHKAFERYNSRNDPTLIQIPFDPRYIDQFWKFGPGASNGVRGTHAAEKIYKPWTCTPPAKPLVLQLRFNNAYLRTYDIGTNSCGVAVVSGSRLTTVPKNEETDRTIAIEPSGNMAIQLALGQYITEVLKSIGLDISTQQMKNKLLACRGSITDGLATIDMKAASDMFKTELVRRLLPYGLFTSMFRVRSGETVLPGNRTVQLNMMSTMGNGFTFPMMTLIFTALVYAVRLKRGGPRDYIDWSGTGIYGDDIIVPSNEASDVISVLQGCGFIVNIDKTFVTGPFRESCGGDYYKGVDVTPFYIRSVSQNSHIYVGLNKTFEWCARQLLLLPNTLLELRSFVRGSVFFVPEWLGNDAGFRTAQVSTQYKYLRPAMPLVRTKCSHFDMMLACGGYINEDPAVQKGLRSLQRRVDRGYNPVLTDYSELTELNPVFTPRPEIKTRYVVKRARLPRGYLDGRDPVSRADRVSSYVESLAWILH